MTRELVVELIRASLNDLNAERPQEAQLDISEQLPLYGIGTQLDSLDFVNFTVSLEARLRQETGASPDLAAVLLDDTAGQPFRTVATLADYLSTKVT